MYTIYVSFHELSPGYGIISIEMILIIGERGLWIKSLLHFIGCSNEAMAFKIKSCLRAYFTRLASSRLGVFSPGNNLMKSSTAANRSRRAINGHRLRDALIRSRTQSLNNPFFKETIYDSMQSCLNNEAGVC